MNLGKNSYQQAVEAVSVLSPSEWEQLFAYFNEGLTASNDSVSQTFADTRFSKGYVCPKCGKTHINRFGCAKRGGKADKRGISDEQICVIGAVSREGKFFFSVVGNGRPTNRQVKNFYNYIT